MVETITTSQLEDKKKNGEEFVLIDVLGAEHFEREHIKGAVNIPLGEIAIEAKERFEENDEIVVYCKDKECQASPKAAEKLEAIGFTNVKDYEPGIKEWKEAGNEVE